MYATGVFLIMCAVNLPMLCAGIVISGLSVGAGVPSSWSYISEMSSSTSRAANIGISQFAWSCGPAVIFLIALLFSFIFPTFGPDGALLPAGTYGPFDGLFAMRLLFLILFVVALIAWNLQRKLEESKDWTEKQSAAEGKRDTFIQMMGRALTNSVNVKSIVFLVAVYLTWNIVAGTMGQFMPLHVRGGRAFGRHDHLTSTGGHVDPHGGGFACHLLEVRRQDPASHPVRGHGRDGAGGLGGHGVLRHAAGGGQRPIAGAGFCGCSWRCGASRPASRPSASMRCGRRSCSRRCIAAACRASCSFWCAACWASGRSWPWRASVWKPPRAS
ncbi:MAG: MFS transporter [Adlercreutzia equolifaciens]